MSASRKPGHAVRQELIGALTGQVAVLSRHEPAVQSVHDRLAQPRVVAEQRLLVVHVDAPHEQVLVDLEARLVDAVLVGELLRLSGREAADVGLVALALQAMRRQVAADAAPRDAVDVVREAERLPRLLAVVPARVAHGQGGRASCSTPGRSTGRPRWIGPLSTSVERGRVSTAEKNGIEMRATKSGATRLSVITSVWLPLVLTLETSSRNDAPATGARCSSRAVERPLEARGVHRRPVREQEALLDRDRVGLAAVRDTRQTGRRHRRDPLVPLAAPLTNG